MGVDELADRGLQLGNTSMSRRNCLFVNSANHRSTRFSQDPYVGMKCTWTRGRLANQYRKNAE